MTESARPIEEELPAMNGAFDEWMGSWANPEQGPSYGGLRDGGFTGITDSPQLHLERAKYESFLQEVVRILSDSAKVKNSEAALRNVKRLIQIKLSGHGFVTLRSTIMDHVLLDVLKETEPKETAVDTAITQVRDAKSELEIDAA